MRSIVLAMAGVQCAAMAQAPQQQAAGRWVVDTAVDRCRLIKTFASPSAMTLAVSTTPGTGYYDLALRGSEFGKRARGKRFPVSLLFHQADRRIETAALAGAGRARSRCPA